MSVSFMLAQRAEGRGGPLWAAAASAPGRFRLTRPSAGSSVPLTAGFPGGCGAPFAGFWGPGYAGWVAPGRVSFQLPIRWCEMFAESVASPEPCRGPIRRRLHLTLKEEDAPCKETDAQARS